MKTLTIHSQPNAPEASRPLLAQLEKALRFIPNVFATLAESPQALEGELALNAALEKGTLTPAERQLVQIAVSAENGCSYCVAAHSTFAGLQRVRREVVEAVRNGTTIPDAKLDALIHYTRELVRQRGFVSDTTVAACLAAGYTRAQLVEVIGHVGLKTIMNYVNNLADTALDAAFEAQRWTPERSRAA